MILLYKALLKCMKMNKKAVFLLFVNLIAISLSDRESVSTSRALELGMNTAFDRGCPSLSKIIIRNNVSDYVTNCTYSVMDSKKITEENVLKFACVIVESALSFICRNGLRITDEYLNLELNKNVSICPFNFSALENYKIFEPNSLAKELIIKDQCLKVCLDLYSPKNQCVVLSKVNQFLINAHYFDSDTSKQVKKANIARTDESVNMSQIIPKQSMKIKEVYDKHSNKDISYPKMSETSTIKSESTSKADIRTLSMAHNAELEPDLGLQTFHDQQNKNFSVKPSSLKPKDSLSSNNPISADLNLISPENANSNFNLDNVESKPDNKNLMEDDDGDDLNTDLADADHFPDIQSSNSLEETNKISLQESSVTKIKNEISGEGFFQVEESHFFFYFLMLSSVIIIGYLAFHNKNKILAYALEGSNNRRSRRRPNPARYRKLESNLEEAISSTPIQSTASNVVY